MQNWPNCNYIDDILKLRTESQLEEMRINLHNLSVGMSISLKN